LPRDFFLFNRPARSAADLRIAIDDLAFQEYNSCVGWIRFIEILFSHFTSLFISDRVEVDRHTDAAETYDPPIALGFSLGCRYAWQPIFVARPGTKRPFDRREVSCIGFCSVTPE